MMSLPENPATAKFLLELAADMVKWFGIASTVEFDAPRYRPRTTSWGFERGNRLVIVVYEHNKTNKTPQLLRFSIYVKTPNGVLQQQPIPFGGWQHHDENLLDAPNSNNRLLWLEGRGVSMFLKTHIHDFLAEASAWP